MKTLLLTTLLLVGSLHLSHANDSYLPESGSPQIFSSHKTISMEKETIKIQVSEKTVKADCWFVFKNNGPAANVRMGFPDTKDSLDPTQRASGFIHFNSYVNGKWTPAQSVVQNGKSWKVKDVAFPANSTTVVRDKYESKTGWANLSNNLNARMAAYTLHTGATWRGNIGRSTVEFTFDYKPRPVLSNDSLIYNADIPYFDDGKVLYKGPGKPTVVGNTLRFVRTNWRPTEKDDIRLYFLPPAKKVATPSVDAAMNQFISALRFKKIDLSLSFVSNSGYKIVNPLARPPYLVQKTVTSSIARNTMNWNNYLLIDGNEGIPGFVETVREPGGDRWKKIGPTMFVLMSDYKLREGAPNIFDNYYGGWGMYIKWKKEGQRWLLGEIGFPVA